MFPSPIGELHFSILVQKTLFVLLHRFRPLSGSYISQFFDTGFIAIITPPFPSPIGELHFSITKRELINITDKQFPSPIGELHFSMENSGLYAVAETCFRPLSGSYISQYHPRNPMFCLGQIGGLRGKSNFIEMQPFWKVKNSHKSSI